MNFKEYQDSIINLQKDQNKSKRESLIDSSFKMIEKTGKISGNVKTIIYEDDTNEIKKNVELLKYNINDILYNIAIICNSVNISLDDIITIKSDNKE